MWCANSQSSTSVTYTLDTPPSTTTGTSAGSIDKDSHIRLVQAGAIVLALTRKF